LNDRKQIAQASMKVMIEFISLLSHGTEQIHLQLACDFLNLGNCQFVDQETLLFLLLAYISYYSLFTCRLFIAMLLLKI
jgi:hypothetical protein